MAKRVGWNGWWLILAFAPAAGACGETAQHGEGEMSAAGKSAGAGNFAGDDAASAGASASGAGATSRGGATAAGAASAGSNGDDAGAGGTDTGGAGGIGGGAGSIGGGNGGTGNEDCNELQLVELSPPCTVLVSLPPAQGGTILIGTYALSAYESPVCFAGLEQTLQLISTAPDQFEARTVANLGDTRANAVMVREGTGLHATATCGGTEPSDVYQYSAYEQQGEHYLVLMTDTQGAFTYRRVGD